MGMAYVLQLTSKLTISHHKDRAVILCVVNNNGSRAGDALYGGSIDSFYTSPIVAYTISLVGKNKALAAGETVAVQEKEADQTFNHSTFFHRQHQQ